MQRRPVIVALAIAVTACQQLPTDPITRAQAMLRQLESSRSAPGKIKSKDEVQLSIFQLDDPVLEQVKEELLKVDIDNLTPVEALNKLQALKKILG